VADGDHLVTVDVDHLGTIKTRSRGLDDFFAFSLYLLSCGKSPQDAWDLTYGKPDVETVAVQHDVWVFKDIHGNTSWAVCGESSDTIMVSLGDAYFESEAYHAPQWCRENNIEYKMITRKINVAI
jgi:hypothetical protein